MVESMTKEMSLVSATMSSVVKNDAQTLRRLMQEPLFDPNTKDTDGWTALTSASIGGRFLCVCCLLSDSATDIDLKNDWGGTPLYLASQENHAQILDVLIRKGANVNSWNGNPEAKFTTPLFVASQQNYIEVMKILLASGADVNKPAHDGTSPLFVASEDGQLEAVKLLLANGAEVDNCDDDDVGNDSGGTGKGVTPLFMAAQEGHYEIAKCLISNGADINFFCGVTPLFIASQKGHLKVVTLLLSSGADMNLAHHQNGASPLYIACAYGQYDVVKKLLHYGADVNQKNHDSCSPLMVASEKGNTKMCRLLIKNGAQVAGDGLKKSCLFLAKNQGHNDTLALLRRRVQTCACCGISAAQAAASAHTSPLSQEDFQEEEEDIQQREKDIEDQKKGLIEIKERFEVLKRKMETQASCTNCANAMEETAVHKQFANIEKGIHQKEEMKKRKKKELLQKKKRKDKKKKTNALNKCSGCGETFYCSVLCQRKHWTVHKAECKILRMRPKKREPVSV